MSCIATYRSFCDVCDTLISTESFTAKGGEVFPVPAPPLGYGHFDLCDGCFDVARAALTKARRDAE